ncbi:DUF1754-domain-containing protein [Parathielavia appendiculata]|uniref:DUF1754-domain-containing protein n=1 Tax=Parathielavia appendiculata TaxID=2587402 RepID=A0AAN6Z7W2_9PEZI|nr:DUF1754-domain-containing protein [Parathielavia appendiculata]
MPSDEYSSVARGPLKLKGAAGVTKKRKKKDKTTDLEKNLSTSGDKPIDSTKDIPDRSPGEDSADKPTTSDRNDFEHREKTAAQKEEEAEALKTETERRFAEAKRKRLKELAESGRIRPELLKTHKQRVEELNAHLARLSEHHDMPKIGPG